MTKKQNKMRLAAIFHKGFGVPKKDAFKMAKKVAVDHSDTIPDLILALPDHPTFTLQQSTTRCDCCDQFHGRITFHCKDGKDRSFGMDLFFRARASENRKELIFGQ